MAKSNNGPAGSLARALQILDGFTIEEPELGVRDVSRRLGIPASTVGRIMVTLSESGVLVQNPKTRHYRIGSKVLQWGRAAQSNLDLRKLAMPVMRQLNLSTGESVSLYVMQGTHRTCIERIESKHPIRYVVSVGAMLPLVAGASGKVLLAFADQETRAALMHASSLDVQSSTREWDYETLDKELTNIRQFGFAVSRGERVEGAGSIAAPVRDSNGACVAALNVSGPLSRLDDRRVQEYIAYVIEAANSISQILGYQERVANV